MKHFENSGKDRILSSSPFWKSLSSTTFKGLITTNFKISYFGFKLFIFKKLTLPEFSKCFLFETDSKAIPKCLFRCYLRVNCFKKLSYITAVLTFLDASKFYLESVSYGQWAFINYDQMYMAFDLELFHCTGLYISFCCKLFND